VEKPPRDGENPGLNLSQNWLRHLRESATKTSAALPCRSCRDRKICQLEELLWGHALESHPEKVPKDKEAQKKFRETLNYSKAR
jgi:hypothetical protein